jgi:transposase
MDPRQERGLVIAATTKITRKGYTYAVPAQSQPGAYTVTVGHPKAKHPTRCTCPDFELRQLACKHVYAVEYVIQRETRTTPKGETVVTETQAVRVTYGQDWSTYNQAATTEKEHFCRLLRDLCDTIEEPEQAMGRPRVPLSDAIFAAAFKVYSTVSGRRFMTDLRAAAERGLIGKAMHYNSVFRAIESEAVTPILHDLITASAAPLKEVEQDFAVDSTGFGCTQYFRYYSVKYGEEGARHDWVKAHAMVGVKTNVVTAVRLTERNGADYTELHPLVHETAKTFTIREVSADKAYSGRFNAKTIVAVGAEPFIPFKVNAKPCAYSALWSRLYHYFAMNREDFLAHYHKRSNVEATFSMIKRVFGDSVRSRTETACRNEVLLKILCHNIRCLVHEIHALGITPTFPQLGCPQSQSPALEVGPAGAF